MAKQSTAESFLVSRSSLVLGGQPRKRGAVVTRADLGTNADMLIESGAVQSVTDADESFVVVRGPIRNGENVFSRGAVVTQADLGFNAKSLISSGVVRPSNDNDVRRWASWKTRVPKALSTTVKLAELPDPIVQFAAIVCKYLDEDPARRGNPALDRAIVQNQRLFFEAQTKYSELAKQEDGTLVQGTRLPGRRITTGFSEHVLELARANGKEKNHANPSN